MYYMTLTLNLPKSFVKEMVTRNHHLVFINETIGSEESKTDVVLKFITATELGGLNKIALELKEGLLVHEVTPEGLELINSIGMVSNSAKLLLKEVTSH